MFTFCTCENHCKTFKFAFFNRYKLYRGGVQFFTILLRFVNLYSYKWQPAQHPLISYIRKSFYIIGSSNEPFLKIWTKSHCSVFCLTSVLIENTYILYILYHLLFGILTKRNNTSHRSTKCNKSLRIANISMCWAGK